MEVVWRLKQNDFQNDISISVMCFLAARKLRGIGAQKYLQQVWCIPTLAGHWLSFHDADATLPGIFSAHLCPYSMWSLSRVDRPVGSSVRCVELRDRPGLYDRFVCLADIYKIDLYVTLYGGLERSSVFVWGCSRSCWWQLWQKWRQWNLH